MKGCEKLSKYINYDYSGIEDAASLLKKSKYAVVLTGAGMSTESGIPDFRSKDGWWKKIDPSTVATTGALLNNYELFREFYKYRIKALENVKPNTGHYVLSEWEKKGIIKSIITQNVDGLHRFAGNKSVYELHGTIRTVRCEACGKDGETDDFLKNKYCSECGGILRPNVVLFGEDLPVKALEGAIEEARKADLFIVIGSSLKVGPANRLPFISQGKKILINLEDTQFDEDFDIVIKGKAGISLVQINQIVGC